MAVSYRRFRRGSLPGDPKSLPQFLHTELLNIEKAFDTVEVLEEFTVATVPPADKHPRRLIYVSDEVGGAIPAFSDGTDWRRMTDRAIIS